MFMIPPPKLIPPIPEDPLKAAYWTAHYFRDCVSPDQWWLMRDVEQDAENRRRRNDWEVRFRILGPRPKDM